MKTEFLNIRRTFGYDIRLGGNVFLGLKFAYNFALVSVSDLRISDYDLGKGDKSNFSTIEVGGGLRF